MFWATKDFIASPRSVDPAASTDRKKRNVLKMRVLPRVSGILSSIRSLVVAMLTRSRFASPTYASAATTFFAYVSFRTFFVRSSPKPIDPLVSRMR